MLQNIIYIECYNRHILVKTITEVYESCQSFQEVVQKLIPAGFIRVHQSFLVNMAHIKEYGNDSITLANGEEVYLAKKKYGEFVKAYMWYLQNGGVSCV